MTKVLVILLVLCVGIWSYVVGTFFPSICHYDTMQQIHKEYNHIKIYEDGSYVGETTSGLHVEGCIEGALCDV